MAEALARMFRDGFIVYKSDPRDGRCLRICVTRKAIVAARVAERSEMTPRSAPHPHG